MSPKALVLGFLVILALEELGRQYSRPGMDFYIFWGVPTAKKLGGPGLGTPYGDRWGYDEVLNSAAERSNDPAFASLAARRRFVLTGTPLAYSLFSLFPLFSLDYSPALGIFRILQILLYIASLILLGTLFRYDWFVTGSLITTIFIAFAPVRTDIGVGNINAIQLFGLTGALAIAESLLIRRDLPGAGRRGALLLTILSFLVLVKPNLVIVGGALALHLWVTHGRRVFFASAMPAAVVGSVFFALPCLYFGTWSIWAQWYSGLTGGRGVARLGSAFASNPVDRGNFSTVVIMARWLRVRPIYPGFAIAVLLVASVLVVCAMKIALRAASTRGQTSEALRASLLEFLRDPKVGLTMGVVATIALSPLAWGHYYVLLLIPALWLANVGRLWSPQALLAIAAVLLAAGAGYQVLGAPGTAFSWVPLWIALLVQILHKGAQGGPDHPGTGGTPAQGITRDRI